MRAALPLVLLLLLSAVLTAPAQAQAEAMLNIQGFSFRPARLEVDPGQAVRVTNLDSAPHSATGDGFDSGVLDNGASATFAAPTTPGEYPFVCKIHPSMRGTLVVRAAAATTPPATITPASSTPPASPPPTTPEPTPTATSPATTTPATSATPTAVTATATAAATTGLPPSPTPTPTHESPGPGLALLLGALAALAVLLARRR